MSTAAAEATPAVLTSGALNPNALLDHLMNQLELKNDAALARVLEVAPPVISKIRHHRLPIGATLLIAAHEVTGLAIAELREIMGDRRKRFRGSLNDAS